MPHSGSAIGVCQVCVISVSSILHFEWFLDDDFEGGAFEMYFGFTEISRDFTLTTIEDEIFEPNENFVVFLQVLSEYQKLGVYIDSANNEAIITIVNDDGKIQYIYHPFILMDVFY